MLPESLTEWFSLVVQVVVAGLAVAGVVWKVIKGPIETQINGLGGRVAVNEEWRVKLQTRIEEHANMLHDHKRDRDDAHDRIGRIEVVVERLMPALERYREVHSLADAEIRERLVRIETKLDNNMRPGRDP